MNSLEQQKRLDLLFEMETIKAPFVSYIAPGVSLKIVVDLGLKDQNGNKKRFYEETRYASDKYKNVDHLISSSFRINCYLVLEYPNPDYVEGSNTLKNHVLFIKAYAMDDISEKMREFNTNLTKCFGVKNNKLYIKSSLVKEVTVYPSMNSSLSFKPDIYDSPFNNRTEMGVRLTINDEFSTIISAETIWPELLYKITRCDLMMLGFQMIQSYMSLLPGMAISEIGSNQYMSSSRYCPYWNEDPEEIANRPESIEIKNSKYKTIENKKNFFSNL